MMSNTNPAAPSEEGARQWRSEQSQLPSFYSPRAEAQQTPEADQDLDRADLPSLPEPSDQSTPSRENDDDATAAAFSMPSSQFPQQPPPPSLLSPAFTPPATPGTATPTSGGVSIPGLGLTLGASSGLQAQPDRREPQGVAVDSSLPTGGCGSKRPRLLPMLPEVNCLVRARIPTTTGAEMWLHLYENSVDNKEHIAIVFGPRIRSTSLDAMRPGETEWDRLVRGAYTGRLYPGRTSSGFTPGEAVDGAEAGSAAPEESNAQPPPPLVRIHSECYTGETVWSARCDCGEQLDEAARLMSLPSNQSGGIIIYLRQEGRGIGLGEKLKAYNLQDLGNDTVEANLLLRHPADARSYGLATAMLRDLGQREIRLLTNNPDKIRAVEGPNREIVVRERVAMVPLSWKGRGGFRAKEVDGYLKTKIEKMGHLLSMDSVPNQ